MSKYIKLEDAIRKYAEMIADEAYWEHGVGNGKPDEEDLDIAREYYSDLPTIEVSEDCISREWIKGICEDMLDEEMLGHMLGCIENAPSVVPTTEQSSIVRCKDCTHYHAIKDYAYCTVINVKGKHPQPTDYCSYAEEK